MMNKILDQLRRKVEKSLGIRNTTPYVPSSGFTPSLLAEAIADAKAVRQTSLANAKFALEEAFHCEEEPYISEFEIKEQLKQILNQRTV